MKPTTATATRILGVFALVGVAVTVILGLSLPRTVEQHEYSRHDSPLEGGGTAGGKPGGPGARCGGPQDRNPCAAVPVLHENEPV